MEDFLKAFPKILFYTVLVLCLVSGAIYFIAMDLGKSLTEINFSAVIPKNIIDILPNNGEGLLVSHFPTWSIALAILVFVSAIIGYYSGLYSCWNPILIIYAILPLSASIILLAQWGLVIVPVIIAVSVFKGLIDVEKAHINAGVIRR